MKRFSFLVIGLLSNIPVWAILPPMYTSETVSVKEFSNPKELVIKYFKPIDRGNSIEVGDPTSSVFRIIYNDEFKPVMFEEFDLQGDLKEMYVREYNEYGHVVSDRKMGSNRLVQLILEYRYQKEKEARSLMETKAYSADKHLLYVKTFSRDKQGNVTNERKADEKGKQLLAYEYFYDEFGNVERQVTINSHIERQSEVEYLYDDRGRKIGEFYYDANGKMTRHMEFNYNENGLMVSASNSVPGGEVHRYEMKYEFDEKGNWVRQEIWKEGIIPMTIIFRYIKY